MNAHDLYPSLALFKAIVQLEDEITVTPPDETKNDTPETKRQKAAAFFGQIKQAVAEKRALIKRTHQATLTLAVDYKAKPFIFTAGTVWDVIFSQPDSGKQADFTHFTIITAVTDPNDAAVSRPDAVYTISCSSVLDVAITNAEESFMAAASNSLAEHPAQSATTIVNLVGLQQIVEQAKIEQAKTAATAPEGQMQILWYPVYGWQAPNMTPINGPLPDPITTYPLQALPPQVQTPAPQPATSK